MALAVAGNRQGSGDDVDAGLKATVGDLFTGLVLLKEATVDNNEAREAKE